MVMRPSTISIDALSNSKHQIRQRAGKWTISSYEYHDKYAIGHRQPDPGGGGLKPFDQSGQ